jgi:type VI secretion system protein ImpJ
LLPEHFFMQEGSLREEQRLQLAMLSLPLWGISALSWDTALLRAGKVQLLRCTLRLSSGVLIDIPGNAGPPPVERSARAAGGGQVLPQQPLRSEFTLGEDGRKCVPLYVHWRGDHRWTDEQDELGIRQLVHSVVLSSRPSGDGVNASFKLGEFEVDADERWSLSPSYVPALLDVTDCPFFVPIVQRAVASCSLLREQLELCIRMQGLAIYGKLSAQQCLRAVYQWQAFWAETESLGVRKHPLEVFRALRDVYLAATVYYEQTPVAVVYEHEQLATSFGALLDLLVALVGRGVPHADHALFVEDDGMRVCVMPEPLRHAKKVFWVVERAHTADELSDVAVKLAAPSRVRTIHQRALAGVKYRRSTPDYSHHFSERMAFFQLAVETEEWSQACSEGQLVYYPRREVDGLRTFLHWSD